MIDLRPDHLKVVTDILKRYAPDAEVRAFGSRVTWTAKDHSDLDLAIVGDGELNSRTLTRIRLDFEESDLPFRVDVLDWHDISPEFQKVIRRRYDVIRKSGEFR